MDVRSREVLEELIVYEISCLRGKLQSKLNCCWARVVVVQTEDNRAIESRMFPLLEQHARRRCCTM